MESNVVVDATHKVERIVRHDKRTDMFKVALVDGEGFVSQILVPEENVQMLAIGDEVELMALLVEPEVER